MSHTEPKSHASRQYAGISFRPEVMEYLDAMAAQLGISRLWVLNTIVLEHARLAHAGKLPSPLSTETVIQL